MLTDVVVSGAPVRMEELVSGLSGPNVVMIFGSSEVISPLLLLASVFVDNSTIKLSAVALWVTVVLISGPYKVVDKLASGLSTDTVVVVSRPSSISKLSYL